MLEKSPKLFFVKENLKLEKILVFYTNSLSFKIMLEYWFQKELSYLFKIQEKSQ
jgi:hypothetical protein